MNGKDIIVMRQKELNRLHVIRRVLERKISQVEATEMLRLSDRQIRRMVARVREEGDRGIIHKSRGHSSNRALDGEVKNIVIGLYRQKYEDFGPTLAKEKLFELNKIDISRETLRKWLIESGDWKKKRKRKKHRRWRERKHCFGQMVQMDGSHHDWFEGRGAKCVLMGYIDDATGEVFARFYEYEGTMPAMDSIKKYVKKYGLPQMIYLDKHSTYKSQKKPTIEEQLKNEKALSQVERAMKELGVRVQHAHSPQAKGRIERLFRTFQDRVIKEMRLAGVKTLEEGNKFLKSYLPKYNKRFRVEARERADVHCDVGDNVDLDRILCKKTKRRVYNDNTVAHDKKLYQLEEFAGAKKQVVVEESPSGRMVIANGEKKLKYKKIERRPKKVEKKKNKIKAKKMVKPKAEHPYKKAMYDRRIRKEAMEAVCC